MVDGLGDVALGDRGEVDRHYRSPPSAWSGRSLTEGRGDAPASHRPEVSIAFAMSRSVSCSTDVIGPGSSSSSSMAVWPQDVARDQEALLHLVVAALEPPVLVLDDAVALVAGPVELAEHDRPVDLTEARDARDLPAHPHRQDSALVQPVPIDHQVLRLEVEDVRGELPEEPLDVDHLEHEMRRVEVEAHRVRPLAEDPPPHHGGRRDVVAAGPL